MKSAIVLAGLALAATAGVASAAPGGLGTAPAVDNGLIQVHGSHRSCQVGPAGNHYHTYRGVRVACRPARPSGVWWYWRTDGGRSGWYHRREKRWH